MTLLLMFTFLWATGDAPNYPAAPGFNQAESDQAAIDIAHKTVAAMGGYEQWQKTRYIKFKFFGMRLHLWDKWTGRLRFEQENLVVLMNVHDKSGKAFENQQEVTDPQALEKHLTSAYEAWINDVYWIAMPYKLKDSGVTLKYVGQGAMENGEQADIVELTFKEVGVTPDNKYHVYVSTKTGLVEEWAFFVSYNDESPRFKTPWTNWQKHGSIMLSDDRGKRKHSDVAVYDALDDSFFTDPGDVVWP